MIPASDWKWFGSPLHFCCADRCLWHLGTQVGEYVISSVGFMRPMPIKTESDLRRAERIGADGLYEVFVFKAGPPHKCGCPTIDGLEIEARRFGFNDDIPWDGHAEADACHREMCEKYAAMQEPTK